MFYRPHEAQQGSVVKFWLISTAILGFLSVALGALEARSLKNTIDDYGKSIYERAVLYQMVHTMALFAVGVIQHLNKETSFSVAGWGKRPFLEDLSAALEKSNRLLKKSSFSGCSKMVRCKAPEILRNEA